MERKLSQIPFQELKVGQKLRSANDKPGVIVGLYPDDDCTIDIKWEGITTLSSVYHFQGDKITFIN